MSRRLAFIVLILTVAVLAACGKGEEGDSDSGDIATGPGVTSDTITLGSLSDLSGPFATTSRSSLEAAKLLWAEKNSAGGVCGRTIEFLVRDHTYDPQKAVSLYREVAPDVLALQNLIGSPVVAALLPTLEEDSMLSGVQSFASTLVSSPVVQMTGSTYDVEVINGIDYLMRERGLQSGATIGHVYLEGEFGENALLGSEYAAEEFDLTLTQQEINAETSDLTAQVSTLERENVEAIIATTTPLQLASLADIAKSAGLDVPIVANMPAYDPELLDTGAGAAMQESVLITGPIAPFSLKEPKVEEVAAAYSERYPDSPPTQFVMYGYGIAQITAAALERACENEDLTREGVVDALHELSSVDTGGVVAGAQDYTDLEQPPAKLTYISQVDADQPGGLRPLGDAFVSEAAEGYQIP